MRWVLALLLLGCQDGPAARPDGAPVAAPRRLPPPEAPPEYLGVIVAEKAVEVTARLDGRLAEVKVRLGDRVTKGQSLAALDVRALRLELEAARAALEAARAEADRARIELAETREKAGRTGRLKQYVSEEESATARYQEKLGEVRHQRAKADVAGAEARVRQVEVTLADAEIRAPFDGVVSARYVDPGATVAAATPIVRLIAADKMWVRFAVPEERARSLAAGDAVRVRVDTLGATFPGAVESISPEVDPAARLVFAEARLDLPETWQKKLPAGVAARVAVTK